MTRFAITFVLAAAIPLGNAVTADDAQQPAASEFKVRPIGHVKKSDDRMLIVLDKQYQPGLLGLDGCLPVFSLPARPAARTCSP